MTEQTPNETFHSSSFLQGHNAVFIEQLYAKYAADPGSVDESWQAFFAALGDPALEVQKEASGPSWADLCWSRSRS